MRKPKKANRLQVEEHPISDFRHQCFDFFPPSPLQHGQYRGVGKSLARPGRKQATATEDFDVHIAYLLSQLEKY